MNEQEIEEILTTTPYPEMPEIRTEPRVLKRDYTWAKRGDVFFPPFRNYAYCHWCGRYKKNHPIFSRSEGRIVGCCVICAREIRNGWDPPLKFRTDKMKDLENWIQEKNMK